MAQHKVNWHLDMGAKKYREGDVIKLEAKDAAPLVALGVLTPLTEDEPSEVEEMSATQLKASTKEQLAEYAKQRYGVDLNPTDQTKDAMLAALAVCAADDVRKGKE